MAKVAAAPSRLTGDSVDLAPLLGKMVGVFVRARDEKNTRFGKRSMSHCLLVAEGAKVGDAPLESIMFQNYFQLLTPGQWYVGIVAKQAAGANEAWVLLSDKLDKKKVKEFVAVLVAIDVTVPTEQLL